MDFRHDAAAQFRPCMRQLGSAAQSRSKLIIARRRVITLESTSLDDLHHLTAEVSSCSTYADGPDAPHTPTTGSIGMAAIQPTLPLAGAEAGTADSEALRKCCRVLEHTNQEHMVRSAAELTESPWSCLAVQSYECAATCVRAPVNSKATSHLHCV
jgi:hypothetical protein